VKISLTESALADLQEIRVYYEEQLVPQVGIRFVTEILDRVEALVDHPDIGRVVSEFNTDDIRELIHKPFRIVYLREPTSIFVVRVWRSERELELS
jgi:plasmid stabilization system protein ParE